MASAKKRFRKDTAKELLQGYFEGLVKQNKKLKAKSNFKDHDRELALLKNGL